MLVEQGAAGGSAQQRAGQQVAVSPAEVQAERPRSAQRVQQRDRARRTPGAAVPAAAQSAGGGHRRPMPPRTRHPSSRRRCRPPPAAVAHGRSSQTVGYCTRCQHADDITAYSANRQRLLNVTSLRTRPIANNCTYYDIIA